MPHSWVLLVERSVFSFLAVFVAVHKLFIAVHRFSLARGQPSREGPQLLSAGS